MSLDLLTAPVVTLLGMPLSRGDLAGFATGLLCVALTVRGSIWNFPAGILNSLILGLVFLQQRLFSDASLQIVFIVLSLQGWVLWARRPSAGSPGLPIRRTGTREALLLGIITLATWILLWRLMLWAKGAAPPIDALVTAFSLAAQWLLNGKRLENWLVWIAVDLVSVPLYWSRSLPLIALLYLIFLGLCVAGWFGWRRQEAAQPR